MAYLDLKGVRENGRLWRVYFRLFMTDKTLNRYRQHRSLAKSF